MNDRIEKSKSIEEEEQPEFPERSIQKEKGAKTRAPRKEFHIEGRKRARAPREGRQGREKAPETRGAQNKRLSISYIFF